MQPSLLVFVHAVGSALVACRLAAGAAAAPAPVTPLTGRPAPTAAAAAATKPHVFLLYVDDWGWANAGYHRKTPTPEVSTPNIDGLVAEGVELNRVYAYPWCAPSRASVMSGRLPNHVNTANIRGWTYDAAQPEVGGQGVPRNMTLLSQLLKQARYYSVFAGKWDVGFATRGHTPHGRGYDSSLAYFYQINDYWTQAPRGSEATGCKGVDVDLWLDDQPASLLNGTAYEEVLFEAHITRAIEAYHGAGGPQSTGQSLFVHYAPHLVHDPYEVPAAQLAQFNFIKQTGNDVKGLRQVYASMTNYLDGVVGNITSLLKAAGLWENTLMLAASDNGGPIIGGSGANNDPLRGGKFSRWEGGIRVNSFASGGYLPAAVRGTKLEALIHVCDFWATLADVLGLPVHDPVAHAAGLPALDSISFWPQLSGENSTSARQELLVKGAYWEAATGLKLFGGDKGAFWTGPTYPNSTTNYSAVDSGNCGRDGCLFDVAMDEGEHLDLAASRPQDMARLLLRVQQLSQGGEFKPQRGQGVAPAACAAVEQSGGFVGPWVP